MLHELGHRIGIFGNFDIDAVDDSTYTSLEKEAANNQKIADAYFSTNPNEK